MNVSPRIPRPHFFLTLLAAAAVATAAGPIDVRETIAQGQSSYRIETPAATWVYHREGGGFSSLIDPVGNDWIAYRPQGGAAGHFRGIPNAVFRRGQEGNNFFHPGHAGPRGSETSLVESTPQRVLLQSRSRDGRWICEWEILPDRARLRMTGVPSTDGGYWFLYEGTPGGQFDGTDLCLRADGVLTALSESWQEKASRVPWVAFISPKSGHSLVVIMHEAPDAEVSYRAMSNAMTVFGFGRGARGLDGKLTRPATFTVAIVPGTRPIDVKAAAERLLAKNGSNQGRGPDSLIP